MMDLAMDGNRDHTAHKSYQKKKKKKQPIKMEALIKGLNTCPEIT